MPEQSHRGRSAFTLIELLTVIAIIGILAALLLTGISQAKARVQLIQCVHNLHQQGLGLQEFVMDNHFYPLELNGNYYKGAYLENGVNWEHAVQMALDMKVFRACFQNELLSQSSIAARWTKPRKYKSRFSYRVPILR